MKKDFLDISNVVMPEGVPKFDFYEKPTYFEIAVPLFERCNLNCGFCFETHNDTTIDYDKILSLPDIVVNQIKDEVLTSGTDTILLRLWGGELFFDALPDEIFSIYRKFANKFNQCVKELLPHCHVDITYLSNGVFTNWQRVDSLLKDTNAKIAFSYDPVDRFTCDTQKEMWLRTLQHYEKLTKYISITLTKKSIASYLSGDEYFNKIPETICIDINYYTANPNWKEYLPSDDDIYAFYKWAIDNKKYNIRIITNIFRYLIPETKPYIERYCDCKHAAQYHEGKCIKDCAKRASSLNRELFYGEYTKDTNESNCTEVKNTLGLTKRGCLTCKHYEYCTMTCWVATIFEGYQITVCPLARIYEYVTEDMIADFKQWESIYGQN